MNRIKTDVLVGGFVLFAFAILMWGTVQIGSFPGLFAEKGQMRLVASFEDVSGLDRETDVLIAGVSVGKVEEIELEGRHARVTLRIEQPGVRIPTDSAAAVRSRGLLGERVVEVIYGNSPEALVDGDLFTRTQAAANVDVLVDRLTDIAGDIKGVSTTFRNVLGNAEGEEALQDIVANIREVSASLRRVVETNEEGIERVVNNLDSFSTDIAQLSGENREKIGEIVDGLHTASTKLNVALDNLATVSARVEAGEGTLGKLLSDDALYDELDATIADARAALREVRRAAEETQEQIPATVLTTMFGSLF